MIVIAREQSILVFPLKMVTMMKMMKMIMIMVMVLVMMMAGCHAQTNAYSMLHRWVVVFYQSSIV